MASKLLIIIANDQLFAIATDTYLPNDAIIYGDLASQFNESIVDA